MEKKEENMEALKKAFPFLNIELLENFLYSFFPVKIQATLPEKTLCDFFQKFLDYANLKENKLRFCEKEKRLFAHFVCNKPEILIAIEHKLCQENIDLHAFVRASLQMEGKHHVAFLRNSRGF